MAISRAAAITESRSGSRAPRSMASSSARATSKGMRSSTSGWMRRRRACTSLPWGGEAIGSARPSSTSESSQPIGPWKSTTRRAASMARSVRLASFSISAQPASVIGALSRKRWFCHLDTCSFAIRKLPMPRLPSLLGRRRLRRRRRLRPSSASISGDRALGEQEGLEVLRRTWDRCGAAIPAPSPRAPSPRRDCARGWRAARDCSVALARWLYQSTASSSSISETMARCWSMTSGPSLLASSCSTSLDIRPPSTISGEH